MSTIIKNWNQQILNEIQDLELEIEVEKIMLQHTQGLLDGLKPGYGSYLGGPTPASLITQK